MPIIKNGKRIEIPAWDGINRTAGPAVAKSQEPVFAENVSTSQIGVLDSRLSSVRTSTTSPTGNVTSLGGLFQTRDSTGLISGTSYTGIFRVANFTDKANDGEELEELRNTGATGQWATAQPLLSQLGDATTVWAVSKPGGTTTRYTWNSPLGTNPQIGLKLFVGKTVTISLPFVNPTNNGTFTVTALLDSGSGHYFDVVNAAGIAEAPIAAGVGGFIDSTRSEWSGCDIEGGLVLTATNRSPLQVRPNPLSAYKYDFYTVADSTADISGMPWGKLAAYYKGRLYTGNILTYTGQRYKNLVMMSSEKVGIVSYVDGDYLASASPVTIKVTEGKYIVPGDSLEVWRDGAQITSFQVTSKTPYSITIASLAVDLKSSDALWVPSTYYGRQSFKWSTLTRGITPANPDSFPAGDDSSAEITMMDVVGNSLLVGTTNSLTSWNGTAPTTLSAEVGSISTSRGWTKLGGYLYFASSLGIYRTGGGNPEILTNPIKDYWLSATGLGTAVMWNWQNSVFCYIGQITVPGDDGTSEKTITNAIVEYDIIQENCYIHSYPTAITHAEEISTNGSRSGVYLNITNTPGYFSNSRPSTVTWATVVTSDVGDIPYMRVDTNWLYPNAQFEKPSYLWFIHADLLQGDGVKLFLKTDLDDWNEVGELRKGLNTITLAANPTDPASSPRCRRFKLSFRSATGKLVRLGRTAIDYTSSLEQLPDPDQGSYDWMTNG